MAKILRTIDQLVGNTPLVGLARYARKHGCQARLLAKLEYFNPTGSIKDRAALNMITMAERRGKLRPGDTIVEQTSGNTGIALAAFAIPRGYRVEIFLERGASLERRLMLQAYGVKLLDYKDALGVKTPQERQAGWVEPERDATLKEIEAYCQAQPRTHFFLNQACNPDNPEVHIQTTGPELWLDTGGKLDILVCMAGTGGTARGLSTYLRRKNPHVQIVLVQPHPVSRMTPQQPDTNIIDGVLPFHDVPPEDITDFISEELYDECIDVKTEEAYATARDVILTEGFLLGTSSAAALCAATQVAQRPENAGKHIVVIMPDNGMKYLTTPMFHQPPEGAGQ